MATEKFVTVAGRPTIEKDPNSLLDYTIDFGAWLAPMSDTIASHTATVSGCTLQTSANDSTRVVVWIAGGTVGTPASATARITTVGGRITDSTIYFKIKER